MDHYVNKKKSYNGFLFATILICYLLLPNLVLAYNNTQSKNISSSGQALTFTFSSLPKSAASIYVKVSIYGDYGSATDTKYADVSIDRMRVERILGGPQSCNAKPVYNQTYKNYRVSALQVQDGKLVVVVQNSRSVTKACSVNKVEVSLSYTNIYAKPEPVFERFERENAKESTYSPGQGIYFRYRLRNAGAAITKPFSIHFYFSTDRTISTSDTYIKIKRTLSQLPSGAHHPSPTTFGRIFFPIPRGLKAGNYYIGAIIDKDKQINEQSENNNTSQTIYGLNPTSNGYFRVASKPDLYPYIQLKKSSYVRNENIPLEVRVANNGIRTRRSTYLYIYRSTKRTYDTSAVLLKRISLPQIQGGDTYISKSLSWRVPRQQKDGLVYFISVVDPNKWISESNEKNNTSITYTYIDSKPELFTRVGIPRGPFKAGQEISILLRNYNQTKFDARNVKVKLYFSESYRIISGKATLFHTKTFPVLKGNSQTSEYIKYTIPAGLLVGKSYYLISIIDEDKTVDERTENNNTSAAAFQILSDKAELKIGISVNPRTIIQGQKVTLNYRAQNYGVKDAQNVVIRFYLSKDQAITTSDTYLGKEISAGTIPKKTNYPKTTNGKVILTLPSSVTKGNYYIGAIVDPANKVSENNETDNSYGAFLQVFSKHPDLSFSYFSSASSVARGAKVSIRFRASNNGFVESKPVKVRFYLSDSQNSLLNSIDLGQDVTIPKLKYRQTTGYLNAQVTIPTNAAKGHKFLVGFIDYNKQLTESREDNNISGRTIQIRLNEADLYGQIRPLARSLRAGQKFSYQVSIYNNGAKEAKKFNVNVYLLSLSSNPNAVLLKKMSIPSLGSQKSIRNQTFTSIVPFGFAPGAGYIRLVIDPEDKVLENSEQNNVINYPITFITTTSQLPDLRFHSIASTPNSNDFRPGQTVSIRYMIMNQYHASGSFKVSFYWTKNNKIDAQSKRIHTATIGGLAPSRSLSKTFSYKLPTSLKFGETYYIRGIVDADNQIKELSESNNEIQKLIRISNINLGSLPELQVAVFGISKSSVKAGDQVKISFRIRNIGSVSARSFTVRLYASPDKIITNKDDYLGTQVFVQGLAPNTYYPKSRISFLNWRVPANMGGSTRPYIGLLVDYNNKIKETSEFNNYASRQLYYPTQGKTLPDLTSYFSRIGFDKNKVKPNQTLKLDLQVRSITANSGAFKIRFYWGVTTDLQKATYLNKEIIVSGGLKKDTAKTLSVDLKMPSQLANGFSHVIVMVDSENQVKERSEVNNQYNFKIKNSLNVPELIARSVFTPNAVLRSGSKITITYQLQNIGGDMDASNVQVNFYLSKDPIITKKDFLLSPNVTIKKIKNGQTYPNIRFGANISLTLPSNMSGAFYVGMIVDPNNQIKEYDETNNTQRSQLIIIQKSAADLVISSMVSNKTAVKAGQSVTLSYRALNTGNLQAGASKIRFFLSKDPLITTSDQYLGKEGSLPALKALAYTPSATGYTTVTVTIPANTTSGNFYIGAYADSSNQVKEAFEQNNFFALPLRVSGGVPSRNNPPKIVGTPPRTAFVGLRVMYRPSVTDQNTQDIHVWKLKKGPTGASVNTRSGVFSWIPRSSDSDKEKHITIEVCDNGKPQYCATQNFALTPRTKCNSDTNCKNPNFGACISGICAKDTRCKENSDCPNDLICVLRRCIPKKKDEAAPEENNEQEPKAGKEGKDTDGGAKEGKGTDGGSNDQDKLSDSDGQTGCACSVDNSSRNPSHMLIALCLFVFTFARRRFRQRSDS